MGARITPEHGADEAVAAPFPFLGNALALDLINTDVVVRGRRRELLPTPDILAQWWAEARRQHPDAAWVDVAADWWRAPETLAAARELRAGLRAVFDVAAAGGTPTAELLEPINDILRLGYPALIPRPEGGAGAQYRVREDSPRGALLPIALSALRLLSEGDIDRLRACENPRCVALFYDTSKSATRRWCGEDCMNRARSAQRYAQTRKTASAAGA